MPLPSDGTPWPPAGSAPISDKMREWGAWWTGNPADLTSFYQGRTSLVADRPSQHRGGVVGALARFWWGRAQQDLTQTRDQVHVPLPADLARTSADLLFAEPPQVTMPDDAAQAWFEDDGEDAMFSRLTGAAERQSVLGGVYLSTAWDPAVSNRVFTHVVAADEAFPEFAWGTLRAVTFSHVIHTDAATKITVRHLERHELDAAGNGLIQHGVYVGAADNLGRRARLEDYPQTAPLAAGVNDLGYVTTGITPGLCVQYVPNTDPLSSKAWAKIPAARYLGSSDFDGVETLFDGLDEIYASWMRDVRLGKARVLVARYMLEDGGPGAGAWFNADQDVFSPLRMVAGEDKDAPITPVQFAIRYAEHQATAREWSDKIIRAAGYSLQTFGDFESGSQMTATEVSSRDARSQLTRGRKIRLWRPALRDHLTKMLTVDSSVFGASHGSPDAVRVTFPDGVVETQLQLAQTAQALRTAEAASTRTIVELTHPEWDDARVEAEAAAIIAERGAGAVDPFAIGG